MLCKCGQIQLPNKNKCITCNESNSLTPLTIQNTGEIVTYTILHTTPEGFNSPLILGIIALDEISRKNEHDQVKLICEGQIHYDDLKIGLRVKVQERNGKYYFMNIIEN